MKAGDLVRHVFAHKRENLVGVLLEKMHDPLAGANDVFRVLWRDGKIGNNVWDYDLVVISESR
tara:strand:- start:3290 stop:3478 length:189 start_codon:yes stop_codon:yes gene_type:complete